MVDTDETEVRTVEYQVRRPHRAGKGRRGARSPGIRRRAATKTASSLEETVRTVERTIRSLGEGEILVEIDGHSSAQFGPRFGVGADPLPSRRLFPSWRWSASPFWGFGWIAASRCAGVRRGEWVWGVFPSASHVVLRPKDVAPGSFADASPRRRGLPLLYRVYRRMLLPPLRGGPGHRDWESGEQALEAALFADWLQKCRWFGAGRAIFLAPEHQLGRSLVPRTVRDATRPEAVDALVWPTARGRMTATGQFRLVRAWDDFCCLRNLFPVEENPSVVAIDTLPPEGVDGASGFNSSRFFWEQAVELFGGRLAAIVHLDPGRSLPWLRRSRVSREVLRPFSPAVHFARRSAEVGAEVLLASLPGLPDPLLPPMKRRRWKHGPGARSKLADFAERAGLVVPDDPEVIAS